MKAGDRVIWVRQLPGGHGVEHKAARIMETRPTRAIVMVRIKGAPVRRAVKYTRLILRWQR